MNKKLKVMGATIALLAVCICGSAFAWLTDYEFKNNGGFTIGKVDLTLTGATTDGVLSPGEEFDINPEITLASDSEEAYVFVQVTLPKAKSAKLISWDDNANGGDGDYVLTSVTNEEVADLTVDSNWICIEDEAEGASDSVSSNIYVYKEALDPGDSTGELYSSAIVKNFAYEESNSKSTAPEFATADTKVLACGISASSYDTPSTDQDYLDMYYDALGQHEAFK